MSCTLVVEETSKETISNASSLPSKTRLDTFHEIIESFQASKFEPSGWFGTNPHYQTVIGSGALNVKIFGVPPRSFNTIEEVIDTPDGDFFDAEFTMNCEEAKAIVVVVHGLESSSKSGTITRLVDAFLSKDFGCCMPNFRGCSGKTHNLPGGYHAGYTDDIDRMVDVLNKRYPEKDIYLCGFSLGGNMVLKFLGEQGETANQRQIKGAIGICVPFDPAACQRKVDVGFNRLLYSESFIYTLKMKAEQQHKLFPESFDIEKVRAARTMAEVDEHYIARIYNFQDKFDYYTKSCSKQWLKTIRVPTVVINALDDPLIDENALPNQEEHVLDAPVRLIYHKHGGHCGFITDRMSTESDSPLVPAHGWIGEEAARVLDYIRSRRS